MSEEKTIANMELDGGVACLDFVNSGFTSSKGAPDRLSTYNDVLVLCERLALFPAEEMPQLKAFARRAPVEAQESLEAIRHLRALMTGLFSSIALKTDEELTETFLDEFQKQLSLAFSRQKLVYKNGQLAWNFSAELNLSAPADAFLLSAYQLLGDHGLQQYIKKCAGCDWLFLDATKNHRRKWCDMQTCGSAHKSKTYYQKKVSSKRTSHEP